MFLVQFTRAKHIVHRMIIKSMQISYVGSIFPYYRNTISIPPSIPNHFPASQHEHSLIQSFWFVLSQSRTYHSFSTTKYMIPQLKIYILEQQTMQFLIECNEHSCRSRYLKQRNSCIAALHQLLCFENLTVAAYFKNFTSTFNIQIHCFKKLISISISINVNQVLSTSLAKTLFY